MDSAKGMSRAASFPGSGETRKGAIDRRGRVYRRQSWSLTSGGPFEGPKRIQ